MTGKLTNGTYCLVNCETNKALDMHTSDRHTLINFPTHAWSNQQWRFTKVGKGWVISSVHTPIGEGYVFPKLDTMTEAGCEVTTGYDPLSWLVKPASVEGIDGDVYQISWPQTGWVLEVNEDMEVRLGRVSAGEASASQCWKFILCEERFSVDESTDKIWKYADKDVQTDDVTASKETTTTGTSTSD